MPEERKRMGGSGGQRPRHWARVQWCKPHSSWLQLWQDEHEAVEFQGLVASACPLEFLLPLGVSPAIDITLTPIEHFF